MNTKIKALLFLGTLASGLSGAPAQAETYIDDRSNAERTISSYFNALNSSQFARAWSYWREGALGNNFQDFVQEHEKLSSIDFKLGDVIEEGAAETTYFQVPIAISLNMEGEQQEDVMRGCFLLKLSSPTVQSPPFSPLQIETAKLEDVKGAEIEDTTPGPCNF